MTVVPEGQTLPVKFNLRADSEGKGVVKVFAFREGVCVASLTVSASIGTSAMAPASTTPATMRLPPAIKAQADLDLMVFRESYRGGQALRYRLSSADSQVTSDFGPHPLDSDPSAYVHAAFDEIQALSATPGGWGAAERTRLERIGADLYESLVPSDLQEVLWQTDRVRSFLIQTEEPWIPWELCRMTITRDGRTEARGYLCELFEMSRWLPGVPAKTSLSATRVGIVAPRDSGLASRETEVAMLQDLAAYGPSVSRVKATYKATITALGSHQYDVVHFIGHGRNVSPANATRSEFRLAGRWRLTPSDISGETRNLGIELADHLHERLPGCAGIDGAERDRRLGGGTHSCGRRRVRRNALGCSR